MTSAFGDLERDAIGELLNVAVGRAAASLSELVGDEVRLSVPFVDFLAPDQAARRLEDETKGVDSVAVRQQFTGNVTGDILLIFPERRSLDLVRAMLGDQLPLDQLTELEQEALLEVGNIILNACLASLASQLRLEVESSLPVYLRGRGARILADGAVPGAELVLFLHVDFALVRNDTHGYLAFVMDIVAARHFLDAVRAFLAGAMGAVG
ncbi:MAG: chemotaxis protein CheX [Magnetospirillum sp.]|nr:chemotaxis protein CheX [Magnetospirillum sp.]